MKIERAAELMAEKTRKFKGTDVKPEDVVQLPRPEYYGGTTRAVYCVRVHEEICVLYDFGDEYEIEFY